MTRSTATKLLEKHRRHWHTQEPDSIVARRAVKIYLSVGLIFIGIALIDVIDSSLRHALTNYRISFAAVIFSIGALFCWQSYRFTRVRKLLTEANTDSR